MNIYLQIRNVNLKTASAHANSQNTQISLTAKISALRVPRNIRTRGVTNAVHDPVIEKTVRIAVILREICEELNNFKGIVHWTHMIFLIQLHFIENFHLNLIIFDFLIIPIRCIRSVRYFEVEFAIQEKESTILRKN